MVITIRKRGGGFEKRKITFVKTPDDSYSVKIAYVVKVDGAGIGTVRRADGRVSRTKNHVFVEMKTVDRWYARTASGKELGKVFPYTEGYATRTDAVVELLEEVLKIRADR